MSIVIAYGRSTNRSAPPRSLSACRKICGGPGGGARPAQVSGMGAITIVCEVDPFRALEAAMDGFEVTTIVDAAARGDLFITATNLPGPGAVAIQGETQALP